MEFWLIRTLSRHPFRALVFAVCLLWVIAPTEAATPHRIMNVAPATKRVALVIGNAAYPGVAALPNPGNDANDFAAKLKAHGFEVTLKTDMPLRQMLRTITEFGDKVTEGSEALFYFAGHGMQVKGRNYLIPTDAQIRSESSVSSEAVDVDQLLDKLSRARLSIVILDACRNNPFERRFRGSGQGLAQINAPTGTLIAYATAPGKVAADGDGRNGLYTAELLTAMDIPGIRIEDVLKRVRGNVVKKSNDTQTPWESSSLTGDFYFIFQGPATVNVQQTSDDAEAETWVAAKSANTVASYQGYLKAYPKGRYATAATIRVAELYMSAAASVERPVAGAPAKIEDGERNSKQTQIEPENRTPMELHPGKVFRDCADCPEMVVIPAGTFQMGSKAQYVVADEIPVHTVNVRSFALGRTEVTQWQWQALMGENPSKFIECGNDCPVDRVSWNEAQEYVKRLSAKTGEAYRLPSEAEWEYACRAGGRYKYCGNDNLDSTAWHFLNSRERTHAVAGKQANAFGLYDMDGNVTEWVQDCWNSNYHGAPTDGSAWLTKICDKRVWRGSNWNGRGDLPSSRGYGFPIQNQGIRDGRLGFRVARTLQ